ncbi:hypothetical protein [Curtobacterium sp. ISL-83]|uniref:hypothetical protein n=1 Tax=Curtobacterium sp. ISL-83 TaxID=2819145 RepID=UPI001BEB9416|nr:hypothetical protein [Curtobacterium sp. ISL-83]MBT2503494.1 hypothetical protein [Curtobacterium sp. ISL-83]
MRQATVPHSKPVGGLQIGATVLAAFSFATFVVLFLVLWLPVWLTGSESSLLLWPLVFLLSALPWSAALLAVILSATAQNADRNRLSGTVCGVSAALLTLAPVALWFGGP